MAAVRIAAHQVAVFKSAPKVSGGIVVNLERKKEKINKERKKSNFV